MKKRRVIINTDITVIIIPIRNVRFVWRVFSIATEITKKDLDSWLDDDDDDDDDDEEEEKKEEKTVVKKPSTKLVYYFILINRTANRDDFFAEFGL